MIKGERKYIKRNTQVIHATMLMNLKSIVTRNKRHRLHTVHSFIGNPKKDIIIDPENRVMIAREWREDCQDRGSRELLGGGYDKNILSLDCGMVT